MTNKIDEINHITDHIRMYRIERRYMTYINYSRAIAHLGTTGIIFILKEEVNYGEDIGTILFRSYSFLFGYHIYHFFAVILLFNLRV